MGLPEQLGDIRLLLDQCSEAETSMQPTHYGVEGTRWEARTTPHSSTEEGDGDEDEAEAEGIHGGKDKHKGGGVNEHKCRCEDEEDEDDGDDEMEESTPLVV
ncbi:hypothetical protein PVK06_026723 [Gossypium arboreum]|uniref:Uncharacterized protein n=1 Tax=Gossypium arboreum TaxID=29729 RepID=A0ABR0NYF9_GOSAR|nr:hypothetical protein PVK06_026723 [Gossypium arboreum]